MIQHFFGTKLKKINGHINTRHKLVVNKDSRISNYLEQIDTVNSFHEYGTTETVDGIFVSSRSEDNIVMSIEAENHEIYGQMWHSERDSPVALEEIAIFKAIFG